MAGHHGGTGSATIPEKPIRRRLQNMPSFVVTRGGEYCFMPGLRALRWLAELDDDGPALPPEGATTDSEKRPTS